MGTQFLTRTGRVLRSTFDRIRRGAAAHALVAPPSCTGPAGCRIEPLEPRTLLSPIPLGPQFRVNTTTPGDQDRAAVASDTQGDLVVAWVNGSDIHAQRYAAGGVPQGSEFTVNSTTYLDPLPLSPPRASPAVAMDDSGDSVVTWFGRDSNFNLSVEAQRFNAAGLPQGSEIQVYSLGYPGYRYSRQPSVAMDAGGDFVVTWAGGTGPGLGSAKFQLYNAAGVPQGGPHGVAAALSGMNPSVAMNAAGSFVIAYPWLNDVVFARQYGPTGAPQGQPVSVNAYSGAAGIAEPSLAMDAGGNFVVAWNNSNPLAVEARRFSAGGIALGNAFTVSTTGSPPKVSMTPAGDFVVASQDFAQQYSAAGIAQGAPVQFNTSGPVSAPSVSLNADGDLAVAWTGVDPDGSAGIAARRLSLSVAISGVVFDDSDADGVRAGGEPGLGAWTVYLDQNGNGQLDLGAPQTTASSNVPQTIEPAEFDRVVRHVFPSVVDGSLSAGNLVGTLTDVNVTLGISFGRSGDLSAVLVSPAGTRVTLFNAVGGAGSNFTNTTFDDQAATSITAGSAPFTGTFRPQGTLAAFNGEDPRGAWAVEVTNRNVGFQGTIDAFSITFTTTGETRTTTGAGGNYSFSELRRGGYLVREVQQAGWIPSAPPVGATAVILKGGAAASVDFGNYQLGSISGAVFNDLDADGVRGKGEAGIPGWLIYQDLDADGAYNAGGAKNIVSPDVPRTFEPALPARSNTTVSGIVGRVTDIDLTLDLSVPLKGDVDAILYNAAGDSIVLFPSYPASSGNLNQLTFDDQAADDFTKASPPYSGSFRPAMPLSKLAGSDPNGTWTLEVTSNSGLPLDHGVLNGWSVTLTTSPEPSVTTDANGDYAFTSLRPGSYVVGEQPAGGWQQTLPAGGPYSVALTSGRALTGCDFANTFSVKEVAVNQRDSAAAAATLTGALPAPFPNTFGVDDIGGGTMDDRYENFNVILPNAWRRRHRQRRLARTCGIASAPRARCGRTLHKDARPGADGAADGPLHADYPAHCADPANFCQEPG
jgi:subtilisin-like proprotein convertase family protein